MTAIKSYLWMTLQGDAGPLNANQKLYLERAYSSVDRLIKLVNDMLNISRIESGRLTVQMQKVDMNKIAQEVVEEVTPRAKELDINVVVQTNPALPPVIADSDKIKEVLFNLIGNSLKFTAKGGNVSISFVLKENYVETKVSDTGAGISVENISKLFQKFAMLSESYIANKTASGTGLGLYISRSIVELHKGKIWATSEGIGKGSQFYFTLKVFNENDFREFVSAQKINNPNDLGIVHTQL
jgi:signal transduction histidine kinase